MESNNGKGKVFLTAADIFAAPLRSEIVEAFGGKLMVQELLGGNALRIWEESGEDGQKRMRLSLIACVVDPETRKPIFTPADFDRMDNLSATEMAKLIQAVNRVNGTTPEEILKNSDASPKDVSVTA